MPTITDSVDIAANSTERDLLAGTILKQLGPGIWRLTLKAASSATGVEHTLKVDSDIAVDQASVLPRTPLTPSDDTAFRGNAEGGSNLLYSAQNTTGASETLEFQVEAERVR